MTERTKSLKKTIEKDIWISRGQPPGTTLLNNDVGKHENAKEALALDISKSIEKK